MGGGHPKSRIVGIGSRSLDSIAAGLICFAGSSNRPPPRSHLPDNPPSSGLAAALADRYAIERELGAGGMATVYLARDLKHGRLVALKVLHPDLSSSLGAERFMREIRTAARLQHPHILSVFDSGDSAGQLWFTMPFVEGESLRELLTREVQLSQPEAIRIASEAARGLAYAHAQGVVHRDIKPENLLLTRDGSTLVADFGIARSGDAAERGLTGTGMSLGTPAYMSPEQASGEREIDARADVYALGAVLYEMLAGEPAFSGPNVQAVIARVLTQDPRPIHLIRPAVRKTLDAVIAKAMSRTTADRYPTMDAFASAITATITSAVTITEPPRRRRMLAVAAVALVVVAAVASVSRQWSTAAADAPESGAAAKSAAIAVLPFENRGRPEDAHIADGVADEIRGKLAGLPGLNVIARVSSNEYRGTTKRQQQVASELGVRYILTGTVQFEPAANGRPARLRVSPELVEINRNAAPVTRWQKPFDADLADVFTVQSDIAGRVASALDIALNATQQSRLAARPTENLAAYDAYLKGEEISHGVTLYDAPTLQRALVEYNRAVALDPGFAPAWARISRAHGLIFYWNSPTRAHDSLSRDAAQRSIALAPQRWEGHWAMGLYHASVAHMPLPAIDEESTALRMAPSNAEVFAALSNAQSFAGQWDASAESGRQARILDPRSVDAFRREGFALMAARRYDDAVAALQHALVLAPRDPQTHYRMFMVRLAQGDRTAATAAIEIPGDSVAQVLALVTGVGYQMTLLPGPLLEAVSRLDQRAYQGDRVMWAFARSRAFDALGDARRARAYSDTLLSAWRATADTSPQALRLRRARVWGLVNAGSRGEALAAAEELIRSLPVERDWIDGAMNAFVAARAFATLGEHTRAVDVLGTLLERRTFVQPGWVRLEKTFDVLRGDPRFDRMVAAGAVSKD